MTVPEPSDPNAPAPDVAAVDPWRRFERWTSVFFVSLAVVAFLAAITVAPVAANDPAVPGVAVAVMVGIAALEIGILAVASVGLDRRLAWGRTVALGLLLVTIGADAVRVVADLSRGQVTIPLAAIVALYLLTTRPGPVGTLAGRDRAVTVAVVALAVVAQVAAFASAAFAS